MHRSSERKNPQSKDFETRIITVPKASYCVHGDAWSFGHQQTVTDYSQVDFSCVDVVIGIPNESFRHFTTFVFITKVTLGNLTHP